MQLAKTVAVALVIVAVAVTYWRPLRRLRTMLGVEHLLSTGHGFLIVGFLLGLAFEERSSQVVSDMSPIIALVAGWVGFACGMRFDLRALRTISPRSYAVAALPACFAGTTVAAASAAACLHAGGGLELAAITGVVLGAAAASTGPTLAAAVRARRAGRSSEARPVLRLIEFSAGVADLVVVLVAILMYPVFLRTPDPVAPEWLIGIAIVGAVTLALVTWLFLGGRAGENERLLLGLAMLVFTAGFAEWLRLSPAAITALSAMVLANLPGRRHEQLYSVVRRAERPAVVILMTGIGFHVTGQLSSMIWPLIASLTLLRGMAKSFAGFLTTRMFPWAPGLSPARHWTGGLVPQGILGLSITLSFFANWEGDLARTALCAVAISSLVNELVAPWFLLRLLRETSRHVRPLPSASGDVA